MLVCLFFAMCGVCSYAYAMYTDAHASERWARYRERRMADLALFHPTHEEDDS